MNEPLPNEFDQLIIKADQALLHSEAILKELVGEATINLTISPGYPRRFNQNFTNEQGVVANLRDYTPAIL